LRSALRSGANFVWQRLWQMEAISASTFASEQVRLMGLHYDAMRRQYVVRWQDAAIAARCRVPRALNELDPG
jgi:hypothetical protein